MYQPRIQSKAVGEFISLLRAACVMTASIVCVVPSAQAGGEQADPPAYLRLRVGEIGISDGIGSPTQYGVSYRMRPLTSWRLSPGIGYALAENGASYAYADVSRDIHFTGRWMLSPSFAVGAFRESLEVSLGRKLEFRSGVELSYRLPNRIRIGLELFHLSNGGTADRNPGTESLVVSVSLPII